jgi:hypothetical protein
MTDAGKTALYIRSVMEEPQLEQILPTQIAVDNQGAQQMTNAQQPMKHTQHVGMKELVILQWTEERITYENVPSALNPSDSLSEPTGRTTFSEHRDILMGRQRPQYVAPLKAFKIIIDSITNINLRELLLHSNTLVYASI